MSDGRAHGERTEARPVSLSPFCLLCAAPLLFSAREAGRGLCGPCQRVPAIPSEPMRDETQSWRLAPGAVVRRPDEVDRTREARRAVEDARQADREHELAMACVAVERAKVDPSDGFVRGALILAVVSGLVGWATGMAMGSALVVVLR